jgi:hypothetical protein
MARPEDTPPESPKEGPEGGGNQQGDVDNSGAHDNRGVITGHVSGYNVITGIFPVSLTPHIVT